MPVVLRDLLDEPSLKVRAVVLPEGAAEQPISWGSTTELPDPVPFLRGQELVMTTALLDRTMDEWRDLATRLAAVPVAAVCLGIGLVHDQPPAELLTAARDAGLTLLVSPVEVPFIAISHWLADQIYAETYAAVQTNLQVQDRLVRELLSRRGVDGMLSELRRQLGLDAVVLAEPGGHVLHRSPRNSRWKPSSSAAAGTRGSASAEVVVDDIPVAVLHTEPTPAYEGVLPFAATVLGLELAREQAFLTGRRELLGQVLEDVLHGLVSDHAARNRLRRLNVQADALQTMVVAVLDETPERLRRVPWELRSVLAREGDPLPTALLDDAVAVVVPEGVDAGQVAEGLHAQLREARHRPAVGLGSARRGVAGLRLGYYEARQAAVPDGVGRSAPLSLTGLLLGNLDLPLAELGHEVLGPLLEREDPGDNHLLLTLRSFLDHDCVPSATAAAMVIHRNTLRYRLEQIEQLLGRDLDRLTDRMELALALAALDAAGDRGRTEGPPA
ncbi:MULTISPECIES: PucR family transcriptional regulator [unclassified Nocardioides]|uniref:PucR family transcriptional regulator n=1 Tax=unclassified Nocardioides TaxID=2615069 RepID=UPI00114FC870|nr:MULTISPECIES: PucR family transcriptional regulator [unclassified Nocardioides]TQK69349.1 purine catabolism regulator [Nocardioides sp. SLBN-35]WGY01351.1 helix-turn-helix domain-containing protein [Nocardioides sp. QY071]